jgi:hypothetical protein
MATTTTYSTTQVMMTLAALAATGATERPSGEIRADQEKRILSGIKQQLNVLGLGPKWTVPWVGLTANRANLAYLAYDYDSSRTDKQLVLSLRGTMAGSPIDTSEDMQVGLMLPFTRGTSELVRPRISQGAMEAFTDIVMGTNLSEALKSYQPSFLYVTGHSLGGAMATTISLWLATFLLPREKIAPYTFAAPTAGDQYFADLFDHQFPSAQCVINHYDLVPNAWQTLKSLPSFDKSKAFYPGPGDTPKGPGPTATPLNVLGALINAIADGTYGNSYVQPTQQPALNPASGSPLFLDPYPPGAQTDLRNSSSRSGFSTPTTPT